MQVPAAAATIVTAIVILAGMRDIAMVLFFLASAFAFFVNLQIAYKIAKGNPKFIGASIAHIGIALLFIGIIASTRYDKHVTLSLPMNQPTNAFGYKLTYVGMSQTPDQRTAYNVTVQSGSSTFDAPLVMYASAYNGGAIMRHPYIFSLVNYDIFSHPALLAFIGRNMMTRDLYLSPQAVENEGGNGTQQEASSTTSPYGLSVPLNLNEPAKVGRYTLTFKGFQVPDDQRQAMMAGQPFQLGSIIQVEDRNGKTETVTPTDEIGTAGQNQFHSVATKSGDEFTVLNVHVDDKTKAASIMLAYMPAKNSPDIKLVNQVTNNNGTSLPDESKQVLIIEATIKPFINLVWGGVIVMVIGFVITWRRRREELAKLEAQGLIS